MADRSNKELNEIIEKYIEAWRGTPTGAILRKAYRGDICYEGICQIIGLDPDDYLKVYDRHQRLPRKSSWGALGYCMRIGDRGY